MGLLAVAAALVAGAFAAGRDGGEKLPQGPPLPREEGSRESFVLTRVADGLVRPTWVGTAPGDAGALWVLEQPGRVVRLSGRRRTTVADLSELTRLGPELGLLGAAFHPGFAQNRRLFLHHTDVAGNTRVIEVRVPPAGRIDVTAARELLRVEQPEENHKGGGLAFGPDGRLYLGLGDGGGAFDPRNVAQDLDSKLGKLLAADVDAGGAPDWAPVAYGLRNPWRFSFDPALSEVWIGDVGENSVEEVNRVFLEADEPPKNFGWSAFEGVEPVEGDRLAGAGELVWPVAGYGHDEGCSVTGGMVYRGAALPLLAGRYLYGDFCSGTFWSLRPGDGGGAEDLRRERATLPQVSHIGADGSGEPVLASSAGTIWRAKPR